MSNITKNQVVDLIERAAHLNQEIDEKTKVEISDIENTAEKYSNKSSEYLAAVIGGGIGLSGGFAISLVGVSMIFSGPIGLIMGASAAVLIWRGRGQNKIERANKKIDVVKKRILSDIRDLPDDAPVHIKEQLWNMYKNAGEVYEKAIIEGLIDGTSKFDIIHEKK